ncbi:Zinc finger, FYVE/PHD-type [Artemisia annua]|uniref:Zinc finger, FYVE/PHD-type n=1 Tax=Artemisia annua TaxID=35608 RepID=A0A2U1KYX5_ARTAN|nr:Zinc finger, FYVE/PHD-type [Artemisia annua]
MDSIIPYEEGLVCQACGDEGFTNAFIYCVKCLGYVIHRYCLDVTPETYDEFVFWYCDDCKPASPYKSVLPKLYNLGPDKEDPTNTAIINTIYHNKLKKTHLKRGKKKRKIVHLLAGNGKVSCPPNEELEKLDTVPRRLNRFVVLGLPKAVSQNQSIESAQLASCFPVKESTLLTHERSQPLKGDATRSLHVKTTPNKKLKMKHKKKKTVSLAAEEDKTSSSKEARKTNDEFVLQTNSVLKEALVNSDSVPNQISPSAEKVVSQKPSAEADNNCSPPKENAKRKRDASSLTTETKKKKPLDPIEHSSCESSCTDTTVKIQEEGQNCEGKQSKPGHDTLVSDSVTEKELIKNPEEYNDQLETAKRMRSEPSIRVTTAGNGAPQLADLNSNVGNIHYQPAWPVPDPIWRGSFNIVETDYDLFEGFIAHVSSRACKQVWDEAITLSSLLRLEMQPKDALWPKSFLESPPSDEKIALYFFPGNPKYERVYEQLVQDMIDEERAMKTTSKNAELLIFASTLLPQPYWRFQGNCYLWGVFKGKRIESSSAVVQDVTVSNISNNHMPERNQANSGKDMLTKVKSVDSLSPQSPLSNYR